MDYAQLYDSLLTDIYISHLENFSPLTKNFIPIAQVRDTEIPELICPSNPNRHFINPSSTIPGTKYALTNYKGISASTMDSLEYGLTGEGTLPGYPSPMNAAVHPDGALFPGKSLRMDDIRDGLENTIQCAETIDDLNSVWIEGYFCSLVGMPKCTNFKGPHEPGETFWKPDFTPGSSKEFDESTLPGMQFAATLAYDFAGEDAGKYPDPAYGAASPITQFKTNYGPSSGHPKVVNHLFCDGSVHSISKWVDYSVYFFAITRNNGDPGGNQWDD